MRGPHRKKTMQIGEAVELPTAPDPSEDKCWACEEGPETTPTPKTDLTEVPSSLGFPENDLTNDSAGLGANLQFKPVWNIQVPTGVDASGVKTVVSATVTPGAHHLIPGNASLAKCSAILDLMVADRGKITADIGYDVNDARNGIWLPGSYGVNEASASIPMKWTQYQFKIEYAFAAMNTAGAQFHDSHPEYSRLVIRSLRALADKITLKAPEKCGICDKKITDKARPPFGLVGRLHRLSSLHRKFLRGPSRKWPVAGGYYTSARSVLKAANDKTRL